MKIINADVSEGLRQIDDASVQCVVTSPPYWGLRDYGVAGQLGSESLPSEYVESMRSVFSHVRRVLRDDGVLWLNLGDSYSSGKCGRADDGSGDPTSRLGPKRDGNPGNSGMGSVKQRSVPPGFKPKELIGIPWRVAFALQEDGWCLRQDIIWHKPNPMPESCRDRCTKSHEYIFMLTKSPRYYFDFDANQEPAAYANTPRGGSTNRYEQNNAGMDNKVYNTRNRRSVWTITPKPFKGAHFAVFPEELVHRCITVSTKPGDTVLDPFLGSGTTLKVAKDLGREGVGIELNPEYVKIAEERIA